MKKILSALFIASSMTGLLAFDSEAASVFKVNTNETHQTIDGFGASDAWSMAFLGKADPKMKTFIADRLFSAETDSTGQPKGIALSIWRFNIGAGSAEQGDSSHINFTTRTECFLKPDGSYDWTAQAGQREFIHMARERGVPTVLGFLNSPPVYFTQNGLATNTGRGGTYNLRPECYGDFAEFLGNVVEGLEKNDGIHIDIISPVNEPDGHWNWIGPKQEGTPATKYEIARATRRISEEFTRRKLNTRIIIPESSDYRCLTGIYETAPDRGNLIRSFFSPDSTETYVGNLPNVIPAIAAHSYWTNTPVDSMKYFRMAVRDTLATTGAGFWQSELCIMQNDEEIGGGHGFDTTMKTALYVARVIHHDLVYADAKTWQWWRSVGGNYKDGLIYHRHNRRNGTDSISDSRLLWALGNYSRFIRPGAVRLGVSRDGISGEDAATDTRGLMCSAYRNTDGSTVVVMINYSDTAHEAVIDPASGAKEMNLWRTSDVEGETLRHIGSAKAGKSVTFPPRSITTLTTAGQ